MKYVRIACSIVLSLAIGVGIGFILSNARIRKAEEEACPDNAATVLEQHSLLLNQVTEMLWNTPEAFYAVREEGESFSQFTIKDILTGYRIKKYLSTEKIQLLQDAASAIYLASVGMYYPMYGRAQAITFCFKCKDGSQRDLLYMRPIDNNAGYTDEEQIKNILEYVTWDWVKYRTLNYPNWYAATRTNLSELIH